MKFVAQVVLESGPFEAEDEYRAKAQVADITRQVAPIIFPECLQTYRVVVKKWEADEDG